MMLGPLYTRAFLLTRKSLSIRSRILSVKLRAGSRQQRDARLPHCV